MDTAGARGPACCGAPTASNPADRRPRTLDPRLRLLDWGLHSFSVLAQRPGCELVIGAPGQPWRLAGGVTPRVDGLPDFHGFDRPGFAKLALSFKLEPVAGGTRVITETRVDTTDALAHRRFGGLLAGHPGRQRGDPPELAACDQAPRRGCGRR